LTKQPFGSGEIALLGSNDGKVTMGSRIGWINAQERSIKALRIRNRSPAMRCQGILQQLFRCRMSHSVVRSLAETGSIHSRCR
jgi:hypothetical protein